MGSRTQRARRDEKREARTAAALDDFRRIVRALRVSSSALQADLGVSGAQLFVLQQLADMPAASLAELAKRTMTDQSSVSVVVSRLVERNLVTRKTSKADARRSEIALSAKGRALLGRAPRPAQERLVDGLRALAPNVLEGLAFGLSVLVAEMGVGGERPSMFFEEEGRARRARSTAPPPEKAVERAVANGKPRRPRGAPAPPKSARG